MSLVNAFRFSLNEGAMITDEEFWLHGRRRSFYNDNIHPLLSDETADKANLELFYGSPGDPPFHFEIITRARKKLDKELAQRTMSVDEAARLAFEVVQETLQRRINQSLKLYFGFNLDDFNRGYYTKNDKKYEIKQDVVKKKALNLITWQDKDEKFKEIIGSRALLMGYDKKDGVQLYYVNLENSALCFNCSNFDTIGYGIYTAGQCFAQYFRQKDLSQRLTGCDRVEGMATLIDSALTTMIYYNRVGGNFNIYYINGTKEHHEDRVTHFCGPRVKLGTEIVFAYKENYLDRQTAFDLIDLLFFKGGSVDEAEALLFQKVKDPFELELLLRGYRFTPFSCGLKNTEIITEEIQDTKEKEAVGV